MKHVAIPTEEIRTFDHYDAQIEALTRAVKAEEASDAVAVEATLKDAMLAAGVPTHNSVETIFRDYYDEKDTALFFFWRNAPFFRNSLFAFLPREKYGDGCLTMVKGDLLRDASLHDHLGLRSNDLIPTNPSGITLEMLPEFARLQRLAR